jgi:hypothetical protein
MASSRVGRFSLARFRRRDRCRSEFKLTSPLLLTLACLSFYLHAVAAEPGPSIIPQLQDRLGLSEAQVRGSLGALLIFVRERLPKPEFDRVSKSIPNAAQIMRETRLNGIVTRPLDDIGDYEASLASLGIGQPLASQVASAVVECLGDAGFVQEQSILVRVIN